MKAEEYFGDWIDVIDKEELRRVVTWVNKINSANLLRTSLEHLGLAHLRTGLSWARPLPSKRSSYWNTVW